MSTIYSNSNSRLLFEKCRNNQSEEAIEMINNKDNLRINVNERYEGGCTSFFICCYLGNLKVAKELVEKADADVTLDSDSIKPFTVACVQGKISIVDYLLSEHGNKIDPDSIITGLVGACQYGFPQIVRRILNRGIDINLVIDDQGATLIYVAVETQNESIVSLLLNYHSSGGFDNSSSSTIVNTNKSRGGYYPIHLASESANIKILEMLLKNEETDVDVQTPDGATSLLIASQNGSIKVVDLLIKYGADPNIQMKSDGSTPLYVAAARHHNNTVEILLDMPNLDVNRSLIDGTTTLHVLSQFGYLDLIQKMFKNFSTTNKKSITIDAKKLDGSTPLHLAARHGQHQVCQFLIDNGADISIECDGDTALSICKRYGRTETIKVLENATNNKLNK